MIDSGFVVGKAQEAFRYWRQRGSGDEVLALCTCSCESIWHVLLGGDSSQDRHQQRGRRLVQDCQRVASFTKQV